MSEELEELSEELINLLKERGELRAEDIAKWGEEKGLLVFTLYVLVNEVAELDYVDASPERVVIDETFNVDIPKWLRYRGGRKESTTVMSERGGEALQRNGISAFLVEKSGKALESKDSKPKPPRRPRQKRERKRVKGGDILSFLTHPPREVEKKKKPEEGAGPPSKKEKARKDENADAEALVRREELLKEISDLLEKPEFEKALRYLSTYWSVGMLRFYKDMERSGVKNPREVLKTLYQRGLVELAELEVINATPKLRELKDTLRKKIRLAEVFGG